MLVKDNTGNARLHAQNLQTGEITSIDLSCEEICEGIVKYGCSLGGEGILTIHVAVHRKGVHQFDYG